MAIDLPDMADKLVLSTAYSTLAAYPITRTLTRDPTTHDLRRLESIKTAFLFGRKLTHTYNIFTVIVYIVYYLSWL